MTLVYRAKKQIKFIDHNPLGPGQYFQNKYPLSQKKSLFKQSSSFASSTIRKNQFNQQSNNIKIGPGSYDIYQNSQHKSKLSNCKVAFSSKVSRLNQSVQSINDKINNNKCKQTGCNGTFQSTSAFWKQQLKQQKRAGNIFKGQKLLKDSKMAKSIPSIPTWQQSYGYRIDQKSQQLIQNKNPNILITHQPDLTQNQWQKKGPGYYFIRQNKNQIAFQWSKSTSKRSPVQIKSNLNNPAPNYYKIMENLNKIGNNLNKQIKNSILSKEPRFNTENKNFKQILVYQKMQKIFGKYMNYQVQEQKNNSSQINSPLKNDEQCFNNEKQASLLFKEKIDFIKSMQTTKLQKLNQRFQNYQVNKYDHFKTQCFQSKSPRFFQHQNKTQHNQNHNQSLHGNRFQVQNKKQNIQENKLKQTKKDNEAINTDSHIFRNTAKIVPFGNHSNRFKICKKQKIGPGYYNKEIQFSGKKGVTIQFKQERFNEDKENNYKPGPGAYNLQAKQLVKKQIYSNYNTNNINNILSKLNSKTKDSQECIQKLYNTYGRQVNFYLKESKIQNNNEKDEFERIKKEDLCQSAAFLSTVQRNCMKKIQKQDIGNSYYNIKNKDDKNNLQNKVGRIKKHKDRYRNSNSQYNESDEVSPGPGQFEISGNMQKKTFNVSYSNNKQMSFI